ncbi:MAG: hypothetical protein OEZ14_15050, partial [Acidimicrobiia bacterium]|nr:hypothetical protein [Acidimicrobiia bacterium]
MRFPGEQMRCSEQSAPTRRGTTARSTGVVGDDQRTTLSFLVATFAVAVSASLGLGQAVAAATATATATDSIDVATPDPAHPMADPDTTVVASEDLLAALSRLQRLPGATAESSAVAGSSTTTRPEVST